MKTKQELAAKILKNAEEEARELLEHAKGVAAFVLRKFPDEVTDGFFDSQVKSTETALLGGYRRPEESGRYMLQRCEELLVRERENER
jgi:hypothetical protein